LAEECFVGEVEARWNAWQIQHKLIEECVEISMLYF